jgi:hypothetical protein
MTPSADFLKDFLTVTPAKDGRVAVTVLLPPDLVRDYCRFLESLASFFQTVNRKSTYADAEARSARLTPEQSAAAAAYASRVVAAYDQYTAAGLDRKTAIRRIAADLRAAKHPWCSPDLVRSQLVTSGRSGRPGRPRRCKP